MNLSKAQIVVLAFIDGCCPCKRRGSEILAKLVREDMKKIIYPDVSRSEKRKVLLWESFGPNPGQLHWSQVDYYSFFPFWVIYGHS